MQPCRNPWSQAIPCGALLRDGVSSAFFENQRVPFVGVALLCSKQEEGLSVLDIFVQSLSDFCPPWEQKG